MASRVLVFLRDEANRALLGWIGGGLAVAAGGLWAVFTFYVDHSKPPPPLATTIVEQKGTGIASSRDTNINAPVTTGANVKADRGSVAIGGNASNTTFITGVTPEMLTSLTRPWEELSESQKKEIAKLQGDLDLNQRQVKSALEIVGEKNVPPERLAAKLVEIAGKFKDLQTAAAAQPGDDSKITALKVEAQKAIQDGELARPTMTQNNLGNALGALGERESGTARLEEAVAAFREALQEFTPARAAPIGHDPE